MSTCPLLLFLGVPAPVALSVFETLEAAAVLVGGTVAVAEVVLALATGIAGLPTWVLKAAADMVRGDGSIGANVVTWYCNMFVGLWMMYKAVQWKDDKNSIDSKNLWSSNKYSRFYAGAPFSSYRSPRCFRPLSGC
ncbi:hypothetical protein BDZ91DRAFT_747577 [Kalaharituber pfeilii]|nr:hypothetical protein BDZ91DRAFT_747577 [Kalaharituber pfeilii]